MNPTEDERGSIWSSRHSPDSLSSPLNLSMPQRRARAGTLPSRLPSRLSSRLDTTQAAAYPHLGSLALVSPGGSDIVYDTPPSSRSAVGQRPMESKLSNLQPIHEPFPSVAAEMSIANHSEPAILLETDSADPNAHLHPAPLASSVTNTPPHPAKLSANESSVPNRSRAGSMNSMHSRPFNPFGNSIWGPGTLTPLASASPASSAGSGNSATPNGLVASEVDALSPYPTDMSGLNHLKPRLGGGNPRMRSYTTMDAAPMFANAAPYGMVPNRSRAQTILNHPLNHADFGANPVVINGAQLGDYSSVPTPALYIANVPTNCTSAALHTVFQRFGRLESAGVLPNRRLAFVVFTSTIQAIEAQATTNGAELYINNGPCSVSFAQVTHRTPPNGLANNPMLNPALVNPALSAQVNGPLNPAVNVPLNNSSLNGSVPRSGPSPAPTEDLPRASTISAAYVLQSLNAPSSEVQAGVAQLKRAAPLVVDAPIVPLSEALNGEERVYNAAVLRDLRRKLEAMPVRDVEELALDMLHELPSLASDYIGNTVVQLVFERSNSDIRDMMLRKLVPVFAATGTHKNGTWAVQKMIDLAKGPRQYALIQKAIRPHLVALLLDQFGNYVVQACLKFGAPYSDFVYAGVAVALPKIAPSRFGARAVRALLESEHTTLANQRLVATSIVQYLSTLALNSNGCLLVSWLLDGFERVDSTVHLKTQSLVAGQLVPRHLAALCMSKIGSGIVVKLATLPAVFEALIEPLNDEVPLMLQQVLGDLSGQGAATVYRLLTSVFPLNSLERQVLVSKIRMCLLQPNAVVPNHKRLLEECGLESLQPSPNMEPETRHRASSSGSHSPVMVDKST